MHRIFTTGCHYERYLVIFGYRFAVHIHVLFGQYLMGNTYNVVDIQATFRSQLATNNINNQKVESM